MKTRYKILIVIAMTLLVYGGLHIAIFSCNAVSDCGILYDFYQYVGFSIVTSMCGTSQMISDTECDEETYEVRLNNGGYFLFFFAIIPISIVAIILYRDRK